MSAFLIATMKIKDKDKFQEYGKKAGEISSAFGAELVIKGRFGGALAGKADHHSTAVIKFPSLEKLDAWYNSDAYQAIIPLRDEGADVVLTKYEAL